MNAIQNGYYIYNKFPCCTKKMNKISFNSDSKKMNMQQKNDYLYNKTDGLFSFGAGLFALGILLNGHNINLKKNNNSGKQKLGVACIITSVIALFASSIVKCFYSKKYESEVKNDSKNFINN